jgi:hypothetical protein
MSDPVRELKRELLAAAERQQRHVAVSAGRTRLPARLAGNRLLLTSATLAVTAAVALVVTAPWSTSPGFLERAQAALTAPAGAVLHQKWVVTTTSTEFACTVRHSPDESWVDQTPPHRYRVLLNGPPPPQALNAGRRALACWNGTGPELGGFLDSGETLEFVPPNRLRTVGARFGFPVDPVADLRQSLNAGTAHDEGETTLDGRTVERIRIDPETRCASPGCPRQPFYWYVDPKTFYPVGMEGPGGIALAEMPFVRLHVVVRFFAYEYLPRTPANLALTDIRAQHPNANGP